MEDETIKQCFYANVDFSLDENESSSCATSFDEESDAVDYCNDLPQNSTVDCYYDSRDHSILFHEASRVTRAGKLTTMALSALILVALASYCHYGCKVNKNNAVV